MYSRGQEQCSERGQLLSRRAAFNQRRRRRSSHRVAHTFEQRRLQPSSVGADCGVFALEQVKASRGRQTRSYASTIARTDRRHGTPCPPGSACFTAAPHRLWARCEPQHRLPRGRAARAARDVQPLLERFVGRLLSPKSARDARATPCRSAPGDRCGGNALPSSRARLRGDLVRECNPLRCKGHPGHRIARALRLTIAAEPKAPTHRRMPSASGAQRRLPTCASASAHTSARAWCRSTRGQA